MILARNSLMEILMAQMLRHSGVPLLRRSKVHRILTASGAGRRSWQQLGRDWTLQGFCGSSHFMGCSFFQNGSSGRAKHTGKMTVSSASVQCGASVDRLAAASRVKYLRLCYSKYGMNTIHQHAA
ncbi:unnamed protein product [Durusdinium trenchii]|uniref:Uncharacterized protein n=2 Tax=Durusdinium trenchii TaxID=1381693 RepID=A0ABP0MX88_9DINO